MNWPQLDADLAPHGLFVMGQLHEDGSTLILIGASSGMWPAFQSSAEASDAQADPLDRWSKRILGTICEAHHWDAIFPSDGPPYAPFIAWATATKRFWQSPTGMLIHDVAGLMISIRGALRIPGLVTLPNTTTAASPCDTCADQPCVSACPIGALSSETFYDVPACKGYLNTPDGQSCMTQGCHTRRACPVSDAFNRDPAQSAFHMRSFNPS
ncbi:MAG: ferredoxin [Aliishimia sp.]